MSNPNQRRAPAPSPFVMSPAKFTGTSLLIGLVAPSAAGKTMSAMELARGIQVVTGGKIATLDTENGRALHYSERYQFAMPDGSEGLHHVPFDPPFNPARYQAAYEYMVKQGVKIIVVDSVSHEHDGIGGVLEMHEEDLEKMKDPSAWGRAKSERREMVNFILQAKSVHWIFCSRAKEKMRWITGRPPEARGLMPQGNEQFLFEMTLSFLLPAGANGVPVMSSPYPDEELLLKIPLQFRHLFTEPRQLSSALGTHLAAWACPSWKGVLPPLPTPMKRGQSTSVSYTSQTTTMPTAAETAAAITASTVAEKPLSDLPTIDSLIAELAATPTIDLFDSLAPLCKRLLDAASPEDAARLRTAANTALDRLEAGVTEAPTVAAPTIAASVVEKPTSAPVAAEERTAITPQQPVAALVGAEFKPPPAELSDIQRLNIAGMEAFWSSVDSIGDVLTQEQAAQIMLDHCDVTAKQPKVGAEDGLTAQAELMKRAQPPFASKASLGVLVRHLKTCVEHPTYKQYCADLLTCDTAENVYECWRVNGDIVEALPDQPRLDARNRTVKRIEEVDSSISQPGPWLTKRIKAGKEAAVASVKANGTPPPAVPPVAPAATETPAASPPAAAAPAAAQQSDSVSVHRPIESDLGQRIALKIEEATTPEARDEAKAMLDRGKNQKRLSNKDAETLDSLWNAKNPAA